MDFLVAGTVPRRWAGGRRRIRWFVGWAVVVAPAVQRGVRGGVTGGADARAAADRPSARVQRHAWLGARQPPAGRRRADRPGALGRGGGRGVGATATASSTRGGGGREERARGAPARLLGDALAAPGAIDAVFVASCRWPPAGACAGGFFFPPYFCRWPPLRRARAGVWAGGRAGGCARLAVGGRLRTGGAVARCSLGPPPPLRSAAPTSSPLTFLPGLPRPA